MQLSEDIRKKVIQFQQTEITEYHIYKRLAKTIKSPENAKILEQIAEDVKTTQKLGAAEIVLDVQFSPGVERAHDVVSRMEELWQVAKSG